VTSPATSPGPVPNIDLSLHWVTENDLVDASIAAVQVRLPEWVPVEGNTEVVLLEGIALQVAQEVFTINQLPRVVFEAVLEINGMVRQAGLPCQVQINLWTTAGITGELKLPKGSVFRAPMPDGTTVDFATLADQTIPVGATGTPVWAQCATLGTRPHAIAAGTVVTPVGTPTWIEQAKTAGIPSGGVDEENDQDFWTRGAALLRSRPSALVVAQNFADRALEYNYVGRAAAWDRWDGTGDKTQLGTDLGHITVACTHNDGTALTQPELDEVKAGLQQRAQAGLTVHVINATYAAGVTVTISVVADPGVNTATLKTGLEADLRAWLAPTVWAWGTAVTTNALIIRAGRYPGVAAVTATGGANWTAPSVLPQHLIATPVVATATVV
jgi:hypothetical protein